ncbi:hypothetical protein [Magnetospirillum sp. 15-1]|uniref:hypothetical protein n=1 Tax=Magnetospirillum sp. 15-1 TaxID=1979370 RepID=UPI000BBC0672|nr:hypothetical protein [Magnetospirillum sp. 15-1]
MTTDNDHTPPSRASALTGLAIAAILVVAGLLLAHKLRELGRLQDCAMQGRTNCVAIDGG